MRRNIPIRTCIGCRKKGAKNSLIRFTFALGKGIQLDRRQVLPGRGAYICRDLTCLEKAWKKKAFARALRIPPAQLKDIGPDDVNRLKEEMEVLISGEEERSKEGDLNEQA